MERKKIVIIMGIITLILFSGCEQENPIKYNLGKITSIKSYSDAPFESSRCIVEVNNSIDVKVKGYYCEIAEEGKNVVKYQYINTGGGYNLTIVE